jgi:integrase
MDRGELGRFLFTAERFDRAHAALAALLGLNGLRVSEACAANIEDLGVERGHRTLRIVSKGTKPAVIPLVPRTARPLTWLSANAIKGRSCGAATATGSTGAPRTTRIDADTTRTSSGWPWTSARPSAIP